MHHSHHRNRRQHTHNGDDDEAFIGSRVDASSDSYNRPRQYAHGPDNYRAPVVSARNSYTREPPPSRHHDDWQSGDPSYSSLDPYDFRTNDYPSRGRDEYDIVDPREPDAWARRVSDPSYRSVWDHRFSSSSTYADPTWTAAASYETRNSIHDVWTPADTSRGGPSTERDHVRESVEGHVEVETTGWRKHSRKDGRKEGGKDDRRGGDPSTWRSDAGWQSRRSESGPGEVDSAGNKNVAAYKTSRPAADDRSWEPAPTWQPQTHSGTQAQSSHKGSRNNQSGKNSKGKKRNHSTNTSNSATKQQGRDWRNDDSTLNNWSKRDANESPTRSARTPRKRRQWSNSRSRSRSPADSYYSRRSSRGRSRSRSASPKRRRRDDVTVRPRSSSPANRGRNWGTARKGREFSKSPTSSVRSRTSRGARRRSISSGSISSRSRSSSRSPVDQPRPKHRLPPATSVRDITMSINKPALSHAAGMLPPQDTKSHRTGSQTNGKQVSQTQRAQHSRRGPSQLISNQRNSYVRSPSPSSSTMRHVPDVRSDVTTSNGQTLGASKNAGFKPIGQASSAVKMFFPTDDDDVDQQPIAIQSALSVGAQTTKVNERFGPRSDVQTPTVVVNPELDRPFSRQTAEDPRDNGVRAHTSRRQDEPPPSPSRSVLPDPSRRASHNSDRSLSIAITPTTQAFDREILHPASPPSEGTRGELYAIISQVGEGTFGKVYKARNTVTRVYVALKRIRMESERDGFPVTAMREIKLLQSLRHQNIVRLYEMMVSNGSVYMVFEYMDHDLTGILSQTQFSFTDAHLKSLCHQMLAGLAYLHHKGVIHRDIKGSNILINNRGELKLADFGLARFYQKRRRSDYTNRVITLWYRPPELLFGATIYGPEVDMWSAGCIMLELFTKKPVFQGNDEIHQLDVIYKIFGTPAPERWSGVADLPWYELVKPREAIPDRFRELFQKWLSPAALDLAERLLSYDPTQRVTALEALEAPYFKQELPQAALPTGLSTLQGEWHELETKRERAKKRRK